MLTHREAPSANGGSIHGLSRLRAAAVHVSLVLFGAAIVARAAQLQLVEHDRWAQRAEQQHVRDEEVAPPRGAILDATGNVLVETREQMLLEIASHELTPYTRKRKGGGKDTIDPRPIVRTALRELRVPDSTIRKVMAKKRQYITLPQRFLAADLERFNVLPANMIARKRVLRRVVSTPPGLTPLMGVLNQDGTPTGGLEQELDEYLRGERGHDPLVRDGQGGSIASPMLTGIAAQPGNTVTLTINQSLQEIAEQQLAVARESTGASGGDVVILDPRDGAILALTGVRNGKPAPSVTPLAEAYEAGSVMKPFAISRLLELKLATPDEVVNTENGTAMIAGRKVTDEHKAPFMAVRDVVRFSSNIGTMKLAQRLSPAQQYAALRDFGFGALTGVPYPAESRGRLPLVKEWRAMSPGSIAIGYEMSATPVQIAAGYAAFANDGELLQPVLVREVRDPQGTVLYVHQRRVLRRVVSPEGAALMRTMLKSVVDSGTARAADLTTYDVGGKSGTARRSEKGRYGAGYNSTFAAIFPVQHPQYVVVARLIDSKKGYFGGVVSGELVNNILEAALATREASLDRAALANVAKPLPPPPAPKPLPPAQRLAARRDSLRRDSLRAPTPQPAEPQPAAARVVVELPILRTSGGDANVDRAAFEMRPVPSVFGLDPRQAVRTLNAAGFQVSVAAGKTSGREVRTRPVAGVLMRAGATVQLETPR
jgi:cell division protein FtsI (penicillin-binding protein 3)